MIHMIHHFFFQMFFNLFFPTREVGLFPIRIDDPMKGVEFRWRDEINGNNKWKTLDEFSGGQKSILG